MPSDLLSIQPGELQFQFELKKQVSCSLQLSNATESYVVFKVKTTSPKKYCVRPNTGLVSPNGSCDVTVTMQAQREAPPDMQCKDKFLVQSVVVPNGFKEQDISQELFNKEPGKEVSETKLKVVYTAPPQPLSPAREVGEDAHVRELGEDAVQAGGLHDRSLPDYGRDGGDLKAKFLESKSQIAKLTEEKKSLQQKTQHLQEEIASFREKSGGNIALEQKSASGFSFLFLLIVGFLGIILGYFLRS